MPEDTLKCPFCEQELTCVPHYTCDNRNCVLYNSYVKKYHILKIMSKINSIKQKSYSEGYEKCKKEMLIKLEQQEKLFITILPIIALKEALEKVRGENNDIKRKSTQN